MIIRHVLVANKGQTSTNSNMTRKKMSWLFTVTHRWVFHCAVEVPLVSSGSE
jgi:hypothetical protein